MVSHHLQSYILDYYSETGENISRTVKYFGYPCRSTLKLWIIMYHLDKVKHCTYNYNDIKYSKEEKTVAVVDSLTRIKV